MRTRSPLLPVLAFVAVSAAMSALAQDVESAGRLAAVQERKYHMVHELEFSLVYLPYDAFYQGLGPEVSYTYHFNDHVAWEVIRGYYSFDLQTNLVARLANMPGGNNLAPTSTEQMNYALSSTVVWSPAYGKFALFNRSVVQGEGFLLIGGTLGKLTSSFQPGPTIGGGLRFFVSQFVSARFDLRYSALIDTISASITHVIQLSLGFAIDLGTRGEESKS